MSLKNGFKICSGFTQFSRSQHASSTNYQVYHQKFRCVSTTARNARVVSHDEVILSVLLIVNVQIVWIALDLTWYQVKLMVLLFGLILILAALSLYFLKKVNNYIKSKPIIGGKRMYLLLIRLGINICILLYKKQFVIQGFDVIQQSIKLVG